jgi:hypothetical protein
MIWEAAAIPSVLRRQLERQELVVRQSPASKDVNTEVKEATALEAVTRRQPVKIQQTGKTSACCNEMQSVRISDSAIVAST